MKVKTLTLLAAVAATLALPSLSMAQTTFKGDVGALKTEVQRRAQLGVHPVIGLNPDEIREGLSRLNSKSENDWVAAWSTIGDRYAASGDRKASADAAAARSDYAAAFRWYSFARWPTLSSASKRGAYANTLKMFSAWDRLTPNPSEVIRLPVQGTEVVAYLRMPAAAKGPSPLIVQISGLDSYKESAAMEGSLRFSQQGIATLVLDAPGTGQSVKVTADAWQSLDAIIRKVVARPDIDRAHVVLIGGSYGAYWATLLAHRDRDVFAGVVAQGAPIDRAFAPAHFKEAVVEGNEYLFDVTQSWMNAFNGVTTVDQLYVRMDAMSLVKQGYIGGPTAPMLLLNGALDTLAPIEDLFMIARSGDTTRDTWINPKGVHMGRQPGVWDSPRINREVVMPWVMRRLGITPSAPAQSGGALGGQLPEGTQQSPPSAAAVPKK